MQIGDVLVLRRKRRDLDALRRVLVAPDREHAEAADVGERIARRNGRHAAAVDPRRVHARHVLRELQGRIGRRVRRADLGACGEPRRHQRDEVRRVRQRGDHLADVIGLVDDPDEVREGRNRVREALARQHLPRHHLVEVCREAAVDERHLLARHVGLLADREARARHAGLERLEVLQRRRGLADVPLHAVRVAVRVDERERVEHVRLERLRRHVRLLVEGRGERHRVAVEVAHRVAHALRGLGEERIGAAEHDLEAVRKPVAVGVEVERIRPDLELDEVGESVVVCVLLHIRDRRERIERTLDLRGGDKVALARVPRIVAAARRLAEELVAVHIDVQIADVGAVPPVVLEAVRDAVIVRIGLRRIGRTLRRPAREVRLVRDRAFRQVRRGKPAPREVLDSADGAGRRVVRAVRHRVDLLRLRPVDERRIGRPRTVVVRQVLGDRVIEVVVVAADLQPRRERGRVLDVRVLGQRGDQLRVADRVRERQVVLAERGLAVFREVDVLEVVAARVVRHQLVLHHVRVRHPVAVDVAHVVGPDLFAREDRQGRNVIELDVRTRWKRNRDHGRRRHHIAVKGELRHRLVGCPRAVVARARARDLRKPAVEEAVEVLERCRVAGRPRVAARRIDERGIVGVALFLLLARLVAHRVGEDRFGGARARPGLDPVLDAVQLVVRPHAAVADARRREVVGDVVGVRRRRRRLRRIEEEVVRLLDRVVELQRARVEVLVRRRDRDRVRADGRQPHRELARRDAHAARREMGRLADHLAALHRADDLHAVGEVLLDVVQHVRDNRRPVLRHLDRARRIGVVEVGRKFRRLVLHVEVARARDVAGRLVLLRVRRIVHRREDAPHGVAVAPCVVLPRAVEVSERHVPHLRAARRRVPVKDEVRDADRHVAVRDRPRGVIDALGLRLALVLELELHPERALRVGLGQRHEEAHVGIGDRPERRQLALGEDLQPAERLHAADALDQNLRLAVHRHVDRERGTPPVLIVLPPVVFRIVLVHHVLPGFRDHRRVVQLGSRHDVVCNRKPETAGLRTGPVPEGGAGGPGVVRREGHGQLVGGCGDRARRGREVELAPVRDQAAGDRRQRALRAHVLVLHVHDDLLHALQEPRHRVDRIPADGVDDLVRLDVLVAVLDLEKPPPEDELLVARRIEVGQDVRDRLRRERARVLDAHDVRRRAALVDVPRRPLQLELRRHRRDVHDLDRELLRLEVRHDLVGIERRLRAEDDLELRLRIARAVEQLEAARRVVGRALLVPDADARRALRAGLVLRDERRLAPVRRRLVARLQERVEVAVRIQVGLVEREVEVDRLPLVERVADQAPAVRRRRHRRGTRDDHPHVAVGALTALVVKPVRLLPLRVDHVEAREVRRVVLRIGDVELELAVAVGDERQPLHVVRDDLVGLAVAGRPDHGVAPVRRLRRREVQVAVAVGEVDRDLLPAAAADEDVRLRRLLRRADRLRDDRLHPPDDDVLRVGRVDRDAARDDLRRDRDARRHRRVLRRAEDEEIETLLRLGRLRRAARREMDRHVLERLLQVPRVLVRRDRDDVGREVELFVVQLERELHVERRVAVDAVERDPEALRLLVVDERMVAVRERRQRRIPVDRHRQRRLLCAAVHRLRAEVRRDPVARRTDLVPMRRGGEDDARRRAHVLPLQREAVARLARRLREDVDVVLARHAVGIREGQRLDVRAGRNRDRIARLVAPAPPVEVAVGAVARRDPRVDLAPALERQVAADRQHRRLRRLALRAAHDAPVLPVVVAGRMVVGIAVQLQRLEREPEA